MLQYELKGFKQVYKLNQGHDKEIDRERVVPQWKQLEARKTIPGGPSISLFSPWILHFSSCQFFFSIFFSPAPHSALILCILSYFPARFFLLLISHLFSDLHLLPLLLLCVYHISAVLSFSCFFSRWLFLSHSFSVWTPSPRRDRREERWCVTVAIFRSSVSEINIDTVCILPEACWLCTLCIYSLF